ncbi:membrane protein [Streptococcus iniae]|nr:membrane protein [Streptococcus iniae]EKB52309.1 hypothetical protein A0G_0144 [Streptococcus iniae 9117]ESR09237.1 membrane protein [Streptococcus iniae IUSA1]
MGRDWEFPLPKDCKKEITKMQKFDPIIRLIPKMPRWLWFLVYGIIIINLSQLLADGFLFFAMVGLGVTFRGVRKRQSYLQNQDMAKRIQQLKDTVHLADRQKRQLSDYILNKDTENFQLTARHLLDKLQNIKSESYQLKEHLPKEVFDRINSKADEVKVETLLQLEHLQIEQELDSGAVFEQQIDKIAPELKAFYHNVQTDHKRILKKLEEADNTEELTAIHNSSMQQFYDILTGYLQIKESPKDYYNAQERLDKALEAIKTFDLDLDENLRKLNESALKDFEVSLRMMQDPRN